MKKITASIINVVLVIVVAIVAGYLIGRLASANMLATELPIRIVETGSPAANNAVQLVRLRDGRLMGTVAGDVTVLVGNEVATLNDDGSFEVAAGPLLTHEVTVTVPEWANFVASSKGKKYYTLASAAGQRISPSNRVYFSTAAEAEKAGYYQ